MTELAELRRTALEEKADRPISDEPGAPGDPRHHREVVAPRGEPRRKAADAHADHLGDGLVATEVHEHAERLVREGLRPSVPERGGDVVRHAAALANRVLR